MKWIYKVDKGPFTSAYFSLWAARDGAKVGFSQVLTKSGERENLYDGNFGEYNTPLLLLRFLLRVCVD